MATTYLGVGDTNFIIANNNQKVVGSTGVESIVIADGVTGVEAAQSIEELGFNGSTTDYAFQQSGNLVLIFKDGVELARVPLALGTTSSNMNFSDGKKSLVFSSSDGTMSLGSVNISSTSPTKLDGTVTTTTPTYSITADKSSIKEGESAVFNITSSGTSAGDSVSYELSGIELADLQSGGSLTGSFQLDASGNASVSIPIEDDLVINESETLKLTLVGTTTSASVTLEDTVIFV